MNVFDTRVFKYIIPGNPSELIHYSRLNNKENVKQEETRRRCAIELERQHEGFPLFRTPLSVYFVFHFSQRSSHPYHTFYPATHNLIANFITFARKILWDDINLIVDEHGRKVYGTDEYTEIIVTFVDDNGS